MTTKQTAAAILVFSFFFLFLHNTKTLSESKPLPSLPFEEIKLEAKSAYVFDITRNKEVFKLNADAPLPLASLTKIMTAVVALENIPQGQKLTDLLSIMLISSSNDVATELSLGVELPSSLGSSTPFVSLMNKKAEELDLGQTVFLNPTGLDISPDIAGAHGSAKDVFKLMDYFIKNYQEIAKITGYESIIVNSHIFKNTDKLTEQLPGIVAGKTGFSDLAGGNLAVIIDIGLGHPVAIIVLGSTEEGRFEDVKKLYKATFKTLTSQ